LTFNSGQHALVAEIKTFTYNAGTISSHVTGEKPDLSGKVGIHREA
jgi:hypothetical protein